MKKLILALAGIVSVGSLTVTGATNGVTSLQSEGRSITTNETCVSGQGTGSSAVDAIVICTPVDFKNIENLPSKFYKLGQDIKLENFVFGNYDFEGELNGNNKTISIEQEFKSFNGYGISLFGYINNGSVYDLNIHLNGNTFEGNDVNSINPLADTVSVDENMTSTFRNIHVKISSGVKIQTTQTEVYFSGLIGSVYTGDGDNTQPGGKIIIENTSVTGSIEIENTGTHGMVRAAGIVRNVGTSAVHNGGTNSEFVVKNSMVNLDVIVKTVGYAEYGGLIGDAYFDTSNISITDSYSKGNVDIEIIGDHSYVSTVGGLIAYAYDQNADNGKLTISTSYSAIELAIAATHPAADNEKLIFGGIVGEIGDNSNDTTNAEFNLNNVISFTGVITSNISSEDLEDENIIGKIIGVTNNRTGISYTKSYYYKDAVYQTSVTPVNQGTGLEKNQITGKTLIEDYGFNASTNVEEHAWKMTIHTHVWKEIAGGSVFDLHLGWEKYTPTEDPTDPVNPTEDTKSNKTLIIVLSVIGGLAVVGAGTYSVIRYKKKKNNWQDQ